MCDDDDTNDCRTTYQNVKNKTQKYIAIITKNMYIDKLYEKADEYSNTIHTLIKMISANIKPNTYINCENHSTKKLSTKLVIM